MAISGPAGVNHVPVAVTHDPLGREMTEEQKLRLREQLSPPVEETNARERLRERRRGSPGGGATERSGSGDAAAPQERSPMPGSIIDSYA